MTPLHWIGKFLHDILAGIPLFFVHVIFIAVPALLIIWVLRLPKEVTMFPDSQPKSWWKDLKLWASLALMMQIVIYFVF